MQGQYTVSVGGSTVHAKMLGKAVTRKAVVGINRRQTYTGTPLLRIAGKCMP